LVSLALFVDVIDRHDTGMIEHRRRRSLLKEALAHCVAHVRQQNFQGNITPQALVNRFVNSCRRTFAEQFPDLVPVM